MISSSTDDAASVCRFRVKIEQFKECCVQKLVKGMGFEPV